MRPRRDARARRGARRATALAVAERVAARARRADRARARRRAGAASCAPRRLPAAQLRARARRRRGLPRSAPADRARASRPSREAAAATEVPGRLQLAREEPPTVLDGAHNPDAVAALVASLPASCSAGGPLALVLGRARGQGRRGDARARCCRCASAPGSPRRPSSRALSPAALQSLARQLGFDASRVRAAPGSGRSPQAREWARERGGAVLATGSVYLVGELLAELERSGTLRRPRAAPRGAAR